MFFSFYRAITDQSFITTVWIAIALPFWSLLRGWTGGSVTFFVWVAFLFYLPAQFALAAVISIIAQNLSLGTEFADRYFQTMNQWFQVCLFFGLPIQIGQFLLNALRMLLLRHTQPHNGHAGSFLLWPTTYRTPPVELALIAVIAIAVYGGLISYGTIIDLLRMIKDMLPVELANWGDHIELNRLFNDTLAVPAVLYALLVLGCYRNGGILPGFEFGTAPPRRRKRARAYKGPEIAKIPNATNQTEDLDAILSRRNEELKAVASTV